jgi:hypothetical protein
MLKTNLSGAKLINADFSLATLVSATLDNADLTGCRVYGISTWDVTLDKATQKNIIITHDQEPIVQVDRLDVAQFMHILLNNSPIRHVIDTITSKVVLILGRFTEERKAVLDALRVALRERDYLPVLFDFEKPANRDISETIATLAHMAKFVVADLTDCRSVSQELGIIVPNLPSVPIQPLLLASQHEYGMFEHFKRYPWVLPISLYEDQDELLGALDRKIIVPAEAKLKQVHSYSR